MGIAEIATLLVALFQFPQTILAFVKLLKSTPTESHDALLKKLQDEAKAFEESGRPSW